MYQPVDKFPNFVAIENKLLDYWKTYRIFHKLREKNAGNAPWSFLDGPITANNPMGVHHAWGRSLKDLYQRFHAMHGHDLRYQNGFDCQGLWVEVEVEKEHGFASKKDINEYGMDRFVRECKERVLTFAARQTEQSVRLGYWMDWDDPETLLKLRDALHDQVAEVSVTTPSGKTVTGNPEDIIAKLGSPEFGGSYFTFSSENNYTIWQFLKNCHEENYVYRGTNVMPWCSRCGTGISQMEMAEGRKIVTHTSVFVRFPIKDRENEAFMVWTTTPWTLPSNVAVAINPEMTYLKVKHGDWVYYVGKDNFNKERIQELEAGGKKQNAKLPSIAKLLKGLGGEPEVLKEVPGSELIGLEYHGPFDDLPAQNTPGGITPFGPDKDNDSISSACHRSIPWKEVSGAEGTGIVHTAPGCGAEDYELGKEHGLVSLAPLTEEGEFVDGYGFLSGKNVLEISDEVVTELKQRGALVSREQYPHVYPHCWRCKTELVFRLVDGWYIKMDWRNLIQDAVPTSRWIPPDGEAREQDWLMNMGDWLISKKRFWGLALPIWECGDCGWFDVIGSEAELKERAIAGWDEFEGHSPHRPHVDAVKIKCGGCGKDAKRVDDVGNPWLDAGIVSFSTMQYNTDREYWDKWFPADFIMECFPGQFRNWFYALLAMSAKLDGRSPFKTLLGHALVHDERGEEMHKSKGNSIQFDEAAEVLGAEIMRYIYASQNPSINLRFPDLRHEGNTNGPDAEVRRKLLTLWNCYSFFVSYATIDGWRPAAESLPLSERNELDRWILSRLQKLVQSADQHLRDFAVHRFMAQFEKFCDELSNWYLRRSRQRFWKSEMDTDKQAAFETLYEVLSDILRLMAPIMPFLTEEIYQNLVRSVQADSPDSVHLCDYPKVDEARVDDALETRIGTVIRIKNAGLNLRNQSKIKVRQPLQTLMIKPRDAAEQEALSDSHLAAQILEECNIKELELLESAEGQFTLGAKLNFKALGPKLGKKMQAAKQHIESLDLQAVKQSLSANGTFEFELDGEPVELVSEDISIEYEAGENRVVLEDAGTLAILNTEINETLAKEGLARDFNRNAQNLRKTEGLELTDRITVQYAAPDSIADAVSAHDSYLKTELLADDIVRVEDIADGHKVKLSGEQVLIAISRQ